MADAAERLSAGLDGAALFLRVARQQALADDPVPSGHADANTVGKRRRRFAEHRLDGLYDEPRSGAPRTIDDQRIAEIIGRTLEETPPDGTHWNLRSMARAVGYAPRPSTGFGRPSDCSRIAARRSSCLRTRCLWRKCATS